jgi:hypothetical protein
MAALIGTDATGVVILEKETDDMDDDFLRKYVFIAD